ncbi:MAG: hypothetical protein L3J49_01560 [Desulfobulbaceae bacterium]|nr:hypothetical protein [Desulfobulbaceae bacterium]
MPFQKQPTLILSVRGGTMARLAPLLQRGFLVPCPGQVTLYDFLPGLPGFNREYITSRIETIFINGCAADSLETTLPVGSTVALSAAMPGLAGAIFRKGGLHASLRSQPARAQTKLTTTDGFITVKLFNTIATDTVEDILPRGILMKGPVLARFFHRQQERLRSLLIDIQHDTNSLSLKKARLLAETDDVLHLKVLER